jgi:hypothetical protein
MENAEYVKVDNGSIKGVSFDVSSSSGLASGTLAATYRDLELSLLSKRTGNSGGFFDSVASFLLNGFKIRGDNSFGVKERYKTGKIDYVRGRGDTFVQYLWFSLRSGLRDVIFTK